MGKIFIYRKCELYFLHKDKKVTNFEFINVYLIFILKSSSHWDGACSTTGPTGVPSMPSDLSDYS